MTFIKKLGNFLISKSFLVSLVLVALFWIILVFGSLWSFDSFTNFGEKIKVPVLASEDKSQRINISQLDQILEGKDLKYEVLDSIYSPNLVEGTILYQDPLPTEINGQYVKSGRVIKVRVSKGTRNVTMPQLKDKSQRYAEGILAIVGLRSKAKYVPSDVSGSIIDVKYKGKNIQAGEKLPINSIIELTIGRKAAGELITVPNLKGLTIKEANARFQNYTALSLYVSCNGCANATDSASAIITSQTPVSGEQSQVPAGSTITAFAAVNYEEN